MDRSALSLAKPVGCRPQSNNGLQGPTPNISTSYHNRSSENSTHLYHTSLSVLLWRARAHEIPRHPDHPLNANAVPVDGDLVHDQVPDADIPAAVPGGGHVAEDPIAVEGEGGQHGGALAGGDLEERGVDEMDGREGLNGEGEGAERGEGDGHDGGVGESML